MTDTRRRSAERNIWYHSRYTQDLRPTDVDAWESAPRLLEDVYSVADAVAFGGLLISLLRHADRVKAASLAQLVNVIAPIMTEPGGPAWRQTSFFPFAQASALGRGEVLQMKIESPVHDTNRYGQVTAVDAVATYDAKRNSTTFFLVNRSVDEVEQVEMVIAGDFAPVGVVATTLSDADVYAKNTLDDPERVSPHSNESVTTQARARSGFSSLPSRGRSSRSLTRSGRGDRVIRAAPCWWLPDAAGRVARAS